MTVEQWCEENGINSKTYYWQRKLFEMTVEQSKPVFVEMPARSNSVTTATIRSGELSVDIQQSADSELNGAIVRALKEQGIHSLRYTDLRRGIDGLATLVRQRFMLDPFSNTLFLFCGRRRDRIKAFYWKGNGFVLLHKRLESSNFQLPRKESEAKALTPQRYRWLMGAGHITAQGSQDNKKGLEIARKTQITLYLYAHLW